MISTPQKEETTRGPVRITLQAEGAGIMLGCIAVYAMQGGSWGLFLVLLLAPDLFMLGYLAGARIGSILYNVAHSYLLPLAIAALGAWISNELMMQIALIWGAHIGMDRAIGYGLKYASHFKDTHLGRV